MRQARIYISGPITKGDQDANYQQFLGMFERLIELGFAPLNPGFSMMVPNHQRFSHDQWLAVDLPWVEVADALIVLPGESLGAKIEMKHASLYGVPVFFELRELIEFFHGQNRICKPGKLSLVPLDNHSLTVEQ